MKTPGDYYGFLPQPDQELLLRAALLPGEDGITSWQAWSNQVDDLHKLDYGSFRLLPLLYKNLINNQIQHALLPKLKGVYHSAWAQNQILFNKTLPVVSALQEHGISVLGMKGITLTFLYYQDEGVRPMDDIDLLVRFEDAPKAIKIVKDMGWVLETTYPNIYDDIYLHVKPSLPFYMQDAEIDVHWYSLASSLDQQRDALFWARARQMEIKGINLFALSVSDEFFLNCIHGIRWNKMPPIRWIADAIVILNRHPDIDWDSLVFQAKKRVMSKRLLTALGYLKSSFNVPIPSEIIQVLENHSVSPQEKREIAQLKKEPGWSSDLPILWARYSKVRQETKLPGGISGILKYFQIQWGLLSTWQVPLYIFNMGLKRVLKFRPGNQ